MHLIKHLDTKQIMLQVLYALMPAILVYIWFFGFSILIQILLAIITALVVESLVLYWRGFKYNDIKNTLQDNSAIITALLLALSVPSIAPWWVIILGVTFSLIFAKHLYGGLGQNIFNPAMVGYVFLLISFPFEMTQWQSYANYLDFSQSYSAIFNNNIDAITGATRLDSVKNNLLLTLGSDKVIFINLAFLLGGIYLLLRKIISWHIPVSILLSIIIIFLLLNLLTINNYNIILHLFSGATMIAAFFIATDPVSAAGSNYGRLIYGILVGFLIVIIRIYGNYPDGVAFAILIANMFVPLIDYYFRQNKQVIK